MTDTERNGSRNQPSSKSLDLQLSIHPDHATEFMGWLRQVVETTLAASLAGRRNRGRSRMVHGMLLT
ncbi:hypothetical protein AYO44_06870 [Planctomycetaceae bacterium SCGC AG-212-F19]|nr:hypothetical protein AYO44_06870 [Planctomycetaceae bacterium SCGC AG-212-F19]